LKTARFTEYCHAKQKWIATPRFAARVTGTAAVVKKNCHGIFHEGWCTVHAQFKPWRDASYVDTLAVFPSDIELIFIKSTYFGHYLQTFT